jgi:hypothetical protein
MMDDWAADTARLIEETVANVRNRVVVPVQRRARMALAAVIVAAAGGAIAILLAIVAFRLLVLAYNELPGPNDNAWMAWMTLGGILLAAGGFCWSKRVPREARGGSR